MMDVITVTGTKGKTTVARVLSDVLESVKDPVLRVDTTGAYLNAKKLIDLKTSLATSGLVPSVSPGRFLTYLADQPLDNAVAVLEASLGSSNSPGLGYRVHRVGVFTNVFEDHLGSSRRLQTREDIARAKSFIFKRIALDGSAVFNADDRLVVETLAVLPKNRNITKIPCGLMKDAFPFDEHLSQGGVWMTVKDDVAGVMGNDGFVGLVALDRVEWTFNGSFEPSVYNLLFILGALWAYFDGSIPAAALKALEDSKLDDGGGRLTVFENKKGVKVIADYAHEKYSLVEVAKLARSLTAENSKVIGVLRLAYDRTDDLIIDTAKYIAPYFDEYVIYDKIDGRLRMPTVTDKRIKFTQEVGKISQVFHDALVAEGATSKRILSEDEALEYAASIADTGDVVVEIVNDDIARSLQFIKSSFNVIQDGKEQVTV